MMKELRRRGSTSEARLVNRDPSTEGDGERLIEKRLRE